MQNDAPSTSCNADARMTRRVNPSRRDALLAAATLFAASWAQPSSAVLAAAEDTVENAVDEYEALEAAGKFKSTKNLEDYRLKHRFRRGLDGRVWLKSSRGDFYAVRLDMQVPGGLLFRSPNGEVFALQTEALQQIDLSSDQVVILLFSEGDWEKQMSPIELEDENGKAKTLKMSEADFRSVIGLIAMEEQAAEGLGADGSKR